MELVAKKLTIEKLATRKLATEKLTTRYCFISLSIAIAIAIIVLPSLVVAVTMDAGLSASQDGYSNIAEAVVGRTITIKASLSFSGGDSVTITSWNFQVTPNSYTLLSQASVGIVTSSSNPTWSLTLNQPGTYTISISPSCSGSICNGDTLTLEAKNSPVLQVTTEDVTLNGGDTTTVSFTVINTGEAIARGVIATISTPSGVTVSSNTQTVTEPGQESGSITSNGVVTQSFTLTGLNDQVVDGSSFTITITSANDGTASATGTITCNNNCYPTTSNETTGGTTGETTSGGVSPSTTEEEQIFTTLPATPSIESNPELLQAITEFLESVDVNALISSSNTLINYVDLTRTYSLDGNEVTINEELSYNYELKAKKFFVYEVLPKSFKQQADNITVITNGVVRIVNNDPGFLIVFDNVTQGDVVNVSFIAASDANSSVLEDITTEVYAIFQEEQPPIVQPPTANVTEEGGNLTNETGKQVAKSKSKSLIWVLFVVIVVVIVLIIIMQAKKKKAKLYNHKSRSKEFKQFKHQLKHEGLIQSIREELYKEQGKNQHQNKSQDQSQNQGQNKNKDQKNKEAEK